MKKNVLKISLAGVGAGLVLFYGVKALFWGLLVIATWFGVVTPVEVPHFKEMF